MTLELDSEKRERERLFKASVSILLKYKTNSLVLVRVGMNQWGPPAGRLEMGEYLIDAVRREVGEETGIKTGNIYFGRESGPDESVKFLSPRYVINIPRERRTDIGLAFEAEYHGPRLSREGWNITGDSEITFAKPFPLPEILSLLSDHLEGRDVLYRPDFNFPLFMAYVLNQRGQSTYYRNPDSGRVEKYPRYIHSWLVRNAQKIEHLRLVRQEDYQFGHEVRWWEYNNPVLTGVEVEEALARKELRSSVWKKKKTTLPQRS